MIVSLPLFLNASDELRPIAIESAPDFDISTNRIETSFGTRSVTSEEIEQFSYANQAIVPAEPWEPLRDAAFNSAPFGRTKADWSRTIGLLRLPFALNESIRSALMSKHSNLIASSFIKELSVICDVKEPIWIGGGTNPPNQRTVTIDRRSRTRIGLHVDSWDEVPISDRIHSTNRICFNLGDQPRYFLFVPFALTDVHVFLRKQKFIKRAHNGRPSQVGRIFLKAFSQIPAARCRIEPGEAYIAPTENLIHDGSSEHQSSFDKILTIRGHIRLTQRCTET